MAVKTVQETLLAVSCGSSVSGSEAIACAIVPPWVCAAAASPAGTATPAEPNTAAAARGVIPSANARCKKVRRSTRRACTSSNNDRNESPCTTIVPLVIPRVRPPDAPAHAHFAYRDAAGIRAIHWYARFHNGECHGNQPLARPCRHRKVICVDSAYHMLSPVKHFWNAKGPHSAVWSLTCTCNYRIRIALFAGFLLGFNDVFIFHVRFVGIFPGLEDDRVYFRAHQQYS